MLRKKNISLNNIEKAAFGSIMRVWDWPEPKVVKETNYEKISSCNIGRLHDDAGRLR